MTPKFLRPIVLFSLFSAFFVFNSPAFSKSYKAVKSWSLGMGTSFERAHSTLDFHLSQALSPNLNLSLKEVFEITPYYKKVRVQNGSHFYTQYRELRWAFGLLLNKDFYFGYGTGMYLDAGIMLGGGKYSGTNVYPENTLTPQISLGFLKDLGRAVHLRFGCKYNPAFSGSPLSASVNLDFNFLRRIGR